MLAAAGFEVEPVAPGVDESIPEMDPVARAVALSRRKALAVAEVRPDAWVIAADQVVTDGIAVWGKPKDAHDHLAGLKAMRGRSHDLVTGFTVVAPDWEESGHERTRLWVRADLTDDELAAYVATAEGRHCAGGYAIEGLGGFLFERVDGDFFNILGLPLLRVIAVLRAHGWRFG